jgi:hypothetical protein
MRVADFVVKPVAPRSGARLRARRKRKPAAPGGADLYVAARGRRRRLTTLAIETAMLLLKGENGQDQDLPG